MVDLLNLAPCGIFTFNDEGIIVQANDTICTLVTIDKENLIGKKLNTIFTLSSLIFYQTHFYPLLKMQRHADEIYMTLKSKEGKEIPVLLSAKRVDAEGGSVENICSCLPIYNRKNYEDEIIAAKKQAEKALQENSALIEAKAKLQQQMELLEEKMFVLRQRNEELKELNSTVSHDLQEPIRKLHLFSDLLVHGESKIPKDDILQKIINQTLRLKQLLIGLQDWMVLENYEQKEEEIDLAEVLLKAKEQLLSKYEGLQIDITIHQLPSIIGDRAQFEVLFYELLSNSVKFRAADRPLKVNIETTILHRNHFKALNDQYHYRDHYKIVFSDNGIGFNEKYKGEVFQLFKKLDKDSRGFGLGLTLCKKVVNNHRGTMSVISKEGEGSSFIIYLPVHPIT